jgi:hypothetical protein
MMLTHFKIGVNIFLRLPLQSPVQGDAVNAYELHHAGKQNCSPLSIICGPRSAGGFDPGPAAPRQSRSRGAQQLR